MSRFSGRNQQTAYGTSTLSNDSNGALTTDQTGQTFTYDGWGELHTNTDSSVFFFYDALGRRISNDHTEQLIYSQDGQVLEDRHMHKDQNLNVVLDSIARQVWGVGYVDQMVLRDHVDESTSTTTRVYALQDANHNTVAITDSTGTVLDRFAYDPDGNVRSGNPNADGWIYLWQGLRREAAGTTFLYDGRSRFDSPVLGRWIQPDKGYFDSTNLYQAFGSNAISFCDPLGLFVKNPQPVKPPPKPAAPPEPAPPPAEPPALPSEPAAAGGAEAAAEGGALEGLGGLGGLALGGMMWTVAIVEGYRLGDWVYESGTGDYIGTTQFGNAVGGAVASALYGSPNTAPIPGMGRPAGSPAAPPMTGSWPCLPGSSDPAPPKRDPDNPPEPYPDTEPPPGAWKPPGPRTPPGPILPPVPDYPIEPEPPPNPWAPPPPDPNPPLVPSPPNEDPPQPTVPEPPPWYPPFNPN